MGKTKKTDIRQLLDELGATGIEEGDFGLEKATLEGKSREDLLTRRRRSSRLELLKVTELMPVSLSICPQRGDSGRS